MLTLEPPQFQIRGLTIFRDHGDPNQFYYLPRERARVADEGRALSFVAYTEDITRDPDFSLDEDRAGGFLTVEVELGPSPDEVREIESELAGLAGGRAVLTQVPFTDGTVQLCVLSQSGQASGAGGGFEVSVAGSSKPSLFGRQTAVFSVRLGGKAANVLFETLQRKADPQAVVTYDLQFLALQPAYNLTIEIDFKETFSYLSHRIGLNLLIAAVDLDLVTQELVNDGKIIIRETDFTGKEQSRLAAEGGLLALVKDLMSPTLFHTLPVPTPQYRALPDSATAALSTPSGTNAFLASGETATPPSPVVAGDALKITFTPIAGGRPAGAAVDISVKVDLTSGVTVSTVKVLYRLKGKATAFTEVALSSDAAASTPTATPTATPTGTATPAGPSGTTTPAGPSGTTTPAGPSGTTTPAGPSGTTTPPAGPSGTTTPGGPSGPATSTPGSTTWTGRIPGQASGETVEYFIRATGTRATASLTQTVPAQNADTAPLSYTVGTSQRSGVDLQVPKTDGPLIGYSLKSIDVTQQIKRKFEFTQAKAETRHYHPSGALSSDSIGARFDPQAQVTRVALGEGPFKVIVIKANAGFDFDKSKVLAATVHVEYGRNAAGTGPLHAIDIPLSKSKPSGQAQFFADEAGTQQYSYFVEFVYDADAVVGAAPGGALRSATFTETGSNRSITVDLDRHSPLLPVDVRAGALKFAPDVIRQVQVRVAPSAAGEGRTVILQSSSDAERVYVLPEAGARSYFHRQTFFFKDDSTVVERSGATDTDLVVNEPTDRIFRLAPQWSDPWNLVSEMLVDVTYLHAAGDTERATLHLTEGSRKSEMAVLRQPGDPESFEMRARFVMKVGEPLTGPAQVAQVAEPLVGLTQANFRVVTFELLDTEVFNADVLGIKLTCGQDVGNPTLPTASFLLRANRTQGAVVVPGLPAGAAVSIAVDVLRRNQPAQRSTTTLNASETTLFVLV